MGGGGVGDPGEPWAPSLGGLVYASACLVPWLLVPWPICSVYVWRQGDLRPAGQHLPGQVPNGPLLPYPRETPPSPSRSLISFRPAWMATGTGRSAWPVSISPGDAAPGPGPALSGLRVSRSFPRSGVPGRAPRASEGPAATTHHPHGRHPHVAAQELQHWPGRGAGPCLPPHQQQRVG